MRHIDSASPYRRYRRALLVVDRHRDNQLQAQGRMTIHAAVPGTGTQLGQMYDVHIYIEQIFDTRRSESC